MASAAGSRLGLDDRAEGRRQCPGFLAAQPHQPVNDSNLERGEDPIVHFALSTAAARYAGRPPRCPAPRGTPANDGRRCFCNRFATPPAEHRLRKPLLDVWLGHRAQTTTTNPEVRRMKRLIATAAVCGVSLFGFTAVAGAAGGPGSPTPSQTAVDHVDAACNAVGTHNRALATGISSPGTTNLLGVGTVFGCTDS
jgi:hypothetical protein